MYKYQYRFLSSYTVHVTGFHACSNNNTKNELNHPLFLFTSVVDQLVIDMFTKAIIVVNQLKDNGRNLIQPPISGTIKLSTHFFHRKGATVLQGLITGKLFVYLLDNILVQLHSFILSNSNFNWYVSHTSHTFLNEGCMHVCFSFMVEGSFLFF